MRLSQENQALQELLRTNQKAPVMSNLTKQDELSSFVDQRLDEKIELDQENILSMLNDESLATLSQSPVVYDVLNTPNLKLLTEYLEGQAQRGSPNAGNSLFRLFKTTS